MLRTMRRYKISQTTTTDMNSIRKCIVSGLFPNAAYLHMSGTYRTVRGDIPLAVHPTSVLYTVKQPSWVVFVELTHTNKACDNLLLHLVIFKLFYFKTWTLSFPY